ATGGEFHVKYCRAGFEGGDDLVGFAVDHLHLMVVRVGEVDPDLPGIRPGHDKDRLAGDVDGTGLLPAAAVHDQHLVAADRGHEGLIACQRPAFQVRHLVYRQFLLAAAVVVENAGHATLRVPEVDQRHAVFAEQSGDVVATFG